MSKKCGYILYMLSDYEASSKYRYTTHVITKSVNGCVDKWMRIPGGGGMYCYVWLSGDAGMKCPLLSVITRSTKVTWTLDISVWFYLPCCHRILTFHLYIIFILPKLVWMWKHSCKKKNHLIYKVMMSATNLIMIHFNTCKILETCKICFLHSLLHWYRFVCKWGW